MAHAKPVFPALSSLRASGDRRVILDSGCSMHLSPTTDVFDSESRLEISRFQGSDIQSTEGIGSLSYDMPTSHGNKELVLYGAHHIDIPHDLISFGSLIREGWTFVANGPEDISKTV